MDVSQEDLSKLSINNSSDDIELDNSYQEDFYSSADEDHADEDDVSDKIPESMLKYFEASENRASQFEKLILEDNEDDDSGAAEVYSIISSRSEDLLMELASDLGLHEDPVKLKEQVMFEMEDEKLNTIPNKACPHTVSDSDITDRVPHNSEDDIECDAYLRSEKQLSLELKTLERKLKEEDERRIVEYEVERKKEQNEQREKEEWRKRRQRDFEEELRQIEEGNRHRPTGMEEMREREAEEKLQQELLKQQELISSLQRQMEEERRAFEKVQEEKRRKTHQSRCRAAITIQAALRGVLARRWTRAELHRKREEQRRCEEERSRREERWRREQEEQRLKQEKENRRRELEEQELKRRSLEYERAKEEDRVQQTEQRRLAWMRDCTSWSKLSLQNKRKQQQGVRTQRRRGARRATEGSGLPLLCPETLLQSGAWNSPQEDNSITFVDCENLANLRVLRLGRNRLTSIHGLAGAVDLDVLELSHNSITRIGGLEPLKRLQKLLLDHNQLISTRGLKEVYTLLHLDLSHNHLSSVEGLDNCALLNTLDLTGNNLTELPSLRNQVLLVELHLEDNSISSLEGLTACWLPLMQLLSGAQNSITHLPSLCHFVSLEKLDIRDNCLSELQNLCESLQGCPLLREVHLTGNPLQQETMWRSSLQRAVPGLQAIDGQPVGSSPALPGPGLVTALLPQNSFLAFCQAQLQQLHTLQHSHTAQLRLMQLTTDSLSSGMGKTKESHGSGGTTVRSSPPLSMLHAPPLGVGQWAFLGAGQGPPQPVNPWLKSRPRARQGLER
nr:leucine-rich repeat and IQ domain-containing protein 1-like [Salvelinus alpinus]